MFDKEEMCDLFLVNIQVPYKSKCSDLCTSVPLCVGGHKYEGSATGIIFHRPLSAGGALKFRLNVQDSGDSDSYEYVDSEEALLNKDKVGDVDGTRLVGGRIASTRSGGSISH